MRASRAVRRIAGSAPLRVPCAASRAVRSFACLEVPVVDEDEGWLEEQHGQQPQANARVAAHYWERRDEGRGDEEEGRREEDEEVREDDGPAHQGLAVGRGIGGMHVDRTLDRIVTETTFSAQFRTEFNTEPSSCIEVWTAYKGNQLKGHCFPAHCRNFTSCFISTCLN